MKQRGHLRLAGILVCVVIAMAAMAIPAFAQLPPPEGSTAPGVNMELVLRAAQLDPHRAANQGTLHAKASVKRVQRRLYREHLLPSKTYIDGVFGSYTKSAYAQWQQRLGYTGLDASGLPGVTSLQKLLGDRYVLERPVSPGARVTYDGRTINVRTRAMLRAAARRLGAGCHLGITQGSYNPGGVGPSKGTHDGGGAVDLDINRLCGRHIRAVVRALRIVGFAAWHRPYIPGVWPEHIHAIAISDPDLSPGAQDQVWDYYVHTDGLADNAPDSGPRVGFHTWEAYHRANP